MNTIRLKCHLTKIKPIFNIHKRYQSHKRRTHKGVLISIWNLINTILGIQEFFLWQNKKYHYLKFSDRMGIARQIHHVDEESRSCQKNILLGGHDRLSIFIYKVVLTFYHEPCQGQSHCTSFEQVTHWALLLIVDKVVYCLVVRGAIFPLSIKAQRLWGLMFWFLKKLWYQSFQFLVCGLC